MVKMVKKLFSLMSLALVFSASAKDKPLLLQEKFQITRGSLPGNWELMKYNALPAVAIKMEDGKCKFIGSGDCIMPVTGSLKDGKVEFSFSPAKYNSKYAYSARIDFRFDPLTRQGLSTRFIKFPNLDRGIFVYGKVVDNHFTKFAEYAFNLKKSELNGDAVFSADFTGDKLTVKLNDHSKTFDKVPLGEGRVAVGRLHFPDVLTINHINVYGDEVKNSAGEKNFSFRIANNIINVDPMFCDVKLQDFGTFYQADLKLYGGAKYTEPGQGNYHGRRGEQMTDPYFKVVTADSDQKFSLYKGLMLLEVDSLVPDYYFDVLHTKPEWPMYRTIRFVKPAGDFMMVVGAEKLLYNKFAETCHTPAETTFTIDGKVLETEFGYSAGQIKVELTSSPDKEIVSRIPKTDPRYDKAVTFAKRNHFFFEGEKLAFDFVLTGKELPGEVSIVLENAFLEKMKDVKAIAKDLPEIDFGVRKLQSRTYSFELDKLPVGVYHLRLTSADKTLTAEKYFAFEVMPRDPNAPPAPIQSGLPYMHDMNTECRGRANDSFDPWMETTVNAPHYISGTNFLPWFAREQKIVPTLQAYGRKYMTWLGSRCLDNWFIKDNLDLLAEADAAHFGVEMQICGSIFGWYRNYKFADFIAFAESIKDPFYNLDEMKKLYAEGKECPTKYYNYTVKNHTAKWADFAAKCTRDRLQKTLDELRKKNPKLKAYWYGPAPIYNSRYIGPETWRNFDTFYMDNSQIEYLIYEDYPEASDYAPPRGSFFLGAISMCKPDFRLTPEYYGNSGGNPDGALIFAHPPFGKSTNNWPIRVKNRNYEYVYATAYWNGDKFGFWNRFGVQFPTYRTVDDRTQIFLRSWGKVTKHLPVAPLRTSAYLFSWDSYDNNLDNVKIIYPEEGEGESAKINTLYTAGESIPYAAETAAENSILNGFQLLDKNIATLNAKDVDILFLPPIRGMKKEVLDHIRRLHKEGVSIVSFERADGLEDLFGLKKSDTKTRVNKVTGTDNFLKGQSEYINEDRFAGWYTADGAEILLNGDTIPVLTAKQNGKASAIFFNVPPTVAIPDMLHEHQGGIGRDCMSKTMFNAIAEIHKRFGDADATATYGRLIGAKTEDGVILTVFNRTETEKTSIITYRKQNKNEKVVSCDAPYQILQDDDNIIKIRVKMVEYDAPFIVIK